MSKVTPTARQSAVAAGTVGLAAIGAVVGAVPAHADGLGGGGLPLNTNAVSAARGMLATNQGQIGGMSLRSIPILGDLPAMLQDALPGDGLLGGLSGGGLSGVGPQQRSRIPVTSPGIAPAAAVAPAASAASAASPVMAPAAQMAAQNALATAAQSAQAAHAAPAAAPASPLDSLSEGLPVKLPLSGLGGLGGLTGGDLLGGLGGGGLTNGLSHLG